MSDMIDRQAAIDALERCKEVYLNNLPTLVYKEDVRQAVMQLPSAQPEQRWILCSERLPDVAQRVLLSGHGQVMVGMLHSFGKYSLEPTGISYVYPKDDIEAWMPLPEPYKGEGD